MSGWQTGTGVVLGLVAGILVAGWLGGSHDKPSPRSGPILSECDGKLSELVIHYEPSAKDAVIPVYRSFLAQLAADVVVHVVCPDEAAWADFVGSLGSVRCVLKPMAVGHPMTTWSRDRWVALAPAAAGEATTLWYPRGEDAEEIWPAREGDQRVATDLALAMAPTVRAKRSEWFFDGGDFLADGTNVFVVGRMLPRNVQRTAVGRREVLDNVAAVCRRPVILLEDAPDHHAGLFMAAAGGGRIIVGDPALGERFVDFRETRDTADGNDVPATLPGGADFSAETRRRFDAVVGSCEAAGYTVVRVPVVPARDGRTFLTYTNVLIDQRDGKRIVYLPSFQGVDGLNAAARSVWEDLGYEVRAVDCTTIYRHFGCLHCLVNVLKRG